MILDGKETGGNFQTEDELKQAVFKYIAKNCKKTSNYHSLYSLKQSITRKVGYFLEERFEIWMREAGYHISNEYGRPAVKLWHK
jgi:hypothetical protein